MADKNLSELQPAAEINLTDLVHLRQGGIDNAGGPPVLKLYKNGSVVQSANLSGVPLTDGTYGTMISINDTQVSANILGIGASITITTPMPELLVATAYQACNVYNPSAT